MQIQNNFVNTYIVDVPKPTFSSDVPGLLNNCVQFKMELKLHINKPILNIESHCLVKMKISNITK